MRPEPARRAFRLFALTILALPSLGCKLTLLYGSVGAAPLGSALYFVQMENTGTTVENATLYLHADVPVDWDLEVADFRDSNGDRGSALAGFDPEIACQDPVHPEVLQPLPAVPEGYRRLTFSWFYPEAPTGGLMQLWLELGVGSTEGKFPVTVFSQIVGVGSAAICSRVDTVTRVREGHLFSDGFEGGNAIGWSAVAP